MLKGFVDYPTTLPAFASSLEQSGGPGNSKDQTCRSVAIADTPGHPINHALA